MESFFKSGELKFTAWFFKGILGLVFLVLLTRTLDLQIVRGEYFKGLADDNRMREVSIIAKRGDILASGGEVIAQSSEVKKEIILDSEAGFIKRAVGNSHSDNLVTEWKRHYPEGQVFAHALGYIGEVNEKELGKVAAECPEKGAVKLGDLTGRGGIEETYDCTLRGVNGAELIEVDARGQKVRTLGRKLPQDGGNITTSLHIGLQKLITAQMQGKSGGVVVLDKDAKILALVSSPSFDPNAFISPGDNYLVNNILHEASLPLLNRTISGSYHPGSIYKPIVALGALENGVISEDFKYEDTGSIVVNSPYGNFSFSNWYYLQYGGKEGEIGITRALARSTDTFFYKVGEMLGPEAMAEWSRRFGLDDVTGIKLPGEVSGLVPDPSWKEAALGERWFLGNTYNTSIGQGDLAVTPLAIAAALTAVTNGGRKCTPQLVQNDEPQCEDLGLTTKFTDIVKKGMVEACTTGGTGYTFFDFADKYGVQVACKTGTAQNVNKDPHSWFFAFAPLDNPEIFAVVLVEEGGEGSKVAGPIARTIFDYWFQ